MSCSMNHYVNCDSLFVVKSCYPVEACNAESYPVKNQTQYIDPYHTYISLSLRLYELTPSTTYPLPGAPWPSKFVSESIPFQLLKPCSNAN